MLAQAGIPVIGHLGLTPQSVNLLGGYRVQGRGEAGELLMRDAKDLQSAGASAIVLEAVPSELAARVTEILSIPTIGIGAGSATDAQVIVWQDLVGLSSGPAPKFVKRYAAVMCEKAPTPPRSTPTPDRSGRAAGPAGHTSVTRRPA
jgi:3-methyl-2-oxobutanoate hydroxymethyltransferase